MVSLYLCFDKISLNSRIGSFFVFTNRASILYVATQRYRFGPARGSQGELAAPLTHAFVQTVFIKIAELSRLF